MFFFSWEELALVLHVFLVSEVVVGVGIASLVFNSKLGLVLECKWLFKGGVNCATVCKITLIKGE